MAMMFQTLERVMGPRDELWVICACGNQKAWPRSAAFKVFQADASPYDVRSRVICQSCRAAGRPRTQPEIYVRPH